MLSWIFTDEFWLRVGPKAVMTQCRRRPAVLMRFFTDERCERRCKALLFFYQFASAYLTSEVIFQDWSETICSPWHKSLSSGGPSSSLTFIFTFLQVICTPSSENPLIEKAYNRESSNDWRDISSFTREIISGKKRRWLIIGQESVCLSVHRFICVWLSDRKANKLLKSQKGVKKKSVSSVRNFGTYQKSSCFDRFVSLIHLDVTFLRCTCSVL